MARDRFDDEMGLGKKSEKKAPKIEILPPKKSDRESSAPKELIGALRGVKSKQDVIKVLRAEVARVGSIRFDKIVWTRQQVDSMIDQIEDEDLVEESERVRLPEIISKTIERAEKQLKHSSRKVAAIEAKINEPVANPEPAESAAQVATKASSVETDKEYFEALEKLEQRLDADEVAAFDGDYEELAKVESPISADKKANDFPDLNLLLSDNLSAEDFKQVVDAYSSNVVGLKKLRDFAQVNIKPKQKNKTRLCGNAEVNLTAVIGEALRMQKENKPLFIDNDELLKYLEQVPAKKWGKKGRDLGAFGVASILSDVEAVLGMRQASIHSADKVKAFYGEMTVEKLEQTLSILKQKLGAQKIGDLANKDNQPYLDLYNKLVEGAEKLANEKDKQTIIDLANQLESGVLALEKTDNEQRINIAEEILTQSVVEPVNAQTDKQDSISTEPAKGATASKYKNLGLESFDILDKGKTSTEFKPDNTDVKGVETFEVADDEEAQKLEELKLKIAELTDVKKLNEAIKFYRKEAKKEYLKKDIKKSEQAAFVIGLINTRLAELQGNNIESEPDFAEAFAAGGANKNKEAGFTKEVDSIVEQIKNNANEIEDNVYSRGYRSKIDSFKAARDEWQADLVKAQDQKEKALCIAVLASVELLIKSEAANTQQEKVSFKQDNHENNSINKTATDELLASLDEGGKAELTKMMAVLTEGREQLEIINDNWIKVSENSEKNQGGLLTGLKRLFSRGDANNLNSLKEQYQGQDGNSGELAKYKELRLELARDFMAGIEYEKLSANVQQKVKAFLTQELVVKDAEMAMRHKMNTGVAKKLGEFFGYEAKRYKEEKGLVGKSAEWLGEHKLIKYSMIGLGAATIAGTVGGASIAGAVTIGGVRFAKAGLTGMFGGLVQLGAEGSINKTKAGRKRNIEKGRQEAAQELNIDNLDKFFDSYLGRLEEQQKDDVKAVWARLLTSAAMGVSIFEFAPEVSAAENELSGEINSHLSSGPERPVLNQVNSNTPNIGGAATEQGAPKATLEVKHAGATMPANGVRTVEAVKIQHGDSAWKLVHDKLAARGVATDQLDRQTANILKANHFSNTGLREGAEFKLTTDNHIEVSKGGVYKMHHAAPKVYLDHTTPTPEPAVDESIINDKLASEANDNLQKTYGNNIEAKNVDYVRGGEVKQAWVAGSVEKPGVAGKAFEINVVTNGEPSVIISDSTPEAIRQTQENVTFVEKAFGGPHNVSSDAAGVAKEFPVNPNELHTVGYDIAKLSEQDKVEISVWGSHQDVLPTSDPVRAREYFDIARDLSIQCDDEKLLTAFSQADKTLSHEQTKNFVDVFAGKHLDKGFNGMVGEQFKQVGLEIKSMNVSHNALNGITTAKVGVPDGIGGTHEIEVIMKDGHMGIKNNIPGEPNWNFDMSNNLSKDSVINAKLLQNNGGLSRALSRIKDGLERANQRG